MKRFTVNQKLLETGILVLLLGVAAIPCDRWLLGFSWTEVWINRSIQAAMNGSAVMSQDLVRSLVRWTMARFGVSFPTTREGALGTILAIVDLTLAQLIVFIPGCALLGMQSDFIIRGSLGCAIGCAVLWLGHLVYHDAARVFLAGREMLRRRTATR